MDHAAPLEASSSLTATLEPEKLFRRMTALVRSALPAADHGGLFLYEPETDSLRLVAPLGREAPMEVRLERGSGVAGRVFAEGQTIHVEDEEAMRAILDSLPEESRQAILEHYGGRMPLSAMGVPLQAKGRLIGVLSLFASAGDRRFFSSTMTSIPSRSKTRSTR